EFVEVIKPVLQRMQGELGVMFFQDIENIVPGEHWEQQIGEALEKSSIAICFLSIHFFSSPFIQNYELPGIERHSSSGLQVMPIFVQPVFIQPNSVFSRVQS